MHWQTRDLSDIGITKLLSDADVKYPKQTVVAVKRLLTLHDDAVTIIIGDKLIEIDGMQGITITDNFKLIS